MAAQAEQDGVMPSHLALRWRQALQTSFWRRAMLSVPFGLWLESGMLEIQVRLIADVDRLPRGNGGYPNGES